jgi:hypothetical protein
MSIETDATRLAMIKAVGGEPFDAGQPDSLWGVFNRAYAEGIAGAHAVESRRPMIECRTSDVALHGLVKDSVIRRVADDTTFLAKHFEPDGTGMTVIVLKA